MGWVLGLGNGVVFRTGSSQSWSSYWTQQSEFFLDGTIITVGSDKYFKDKSTNGRNFLITGYDFASDWTTGFPYKSAATISAPAGDAALIAADINNFLYAGDGTPNALPVVSLFQDIDYEHKIFCKHVARVVDANLCEVTQPRVSAVFMATDVLTGADLTKAQTDFSVPAEVTTNVKWIDTVNGNDTYAGTKAAPYATFSKAISESMTGYTIYIKSSALNESAMIINKGISVIGTGYSRNDYATNYCFYIQSNITNAVSICGIICGKNNAIGINITISTADVNIDRMKLYATNPVQNNNYDATSKITISNSIMYGSRIWLKKVSVLTGNYIGDITGSVASVLTYYNLSSSYNYYKINAAGLIQHQTENTEVNLFNDTLNGNIFTDQAIATEKTIIVNRCVCSPTATGIFMKSTNAANRITWVITNSSFNQTGKHGATGFEIAGYDITFTGNAVTEYSGNYSFSALTSGRTLTFSNNVCISTLNQYLLSTAYTLIKNGNSIISDGVSYTRVKGGYASIPATISGNLMISKTAGNSFVYLGEEYTNTTDGHLNGTEIYNNRFSGPGDWGNDIDAMHALFSWNQQANWHHNFLSGTFLGYVLKSNGGTYAHQIHHNIIKNCSMSFTIKGNKGALIYNNTCKDAQGYDGLSEDEVGWEGDSGNSVIKNNIFDLNNALHRAIKIQDATDASGVVSDHNVLHNPANNLIGAIGATSYVLADWQTAGYDGNGSGANPNLNAALVPVQSIGIGEDLGAAYDDGLDVSTVWSLSALPVVVTKQQGATWQVGAYVQ